MNSTTSITSPGPTAYATLSDPLYANQQLNPVGHVDRAPSVGLSPLVIAGLVLAVADFAVYPPPSSLTDPLALDRGRAFVVLLEHRR